MEREYFQNVHPDVLKGIENRRARPMWSVACTNYIPCAAMMQCGAGIRNYNNNNINKIKKDSGDPAHTQWHR